MGTTPEWQRKRREYERFWARHKGRRLRDICTICSNKAELACLCDATQYCSKACQLVDWKSRGHRARCKALRAAKAAAAASEAPTQPDATPVNADGAEAVEAVVEAGEAGAGSGESRNAAVDAGASPAPSTATKKRRRAPSPEPAPEEAPEIVDDVPSDSFSSSDHGSAVAAESPPRRAAAEASPGAYGRHGDRCPVCFDGWSASNWRDKKIYECCCRGICSTCAEELDRGDAPCALCRTPPPRDVPAAFARVKRHVRAGVPEAMLLLAAAYRRGDLGMPQRLKAAAKLVKAAAKLGLADAWCKQAEWLLEDRGDCDAAEALLRKAAERGHAHAVLHLAVELLRRTADDVEAFDERARDARNAEAISILGVLARDHECPIATFRLACAVEMGHGGLEPDAGRANCLYALAARRGAAPAVAICKIIDGAGDVRPCLLRALDDDDRRADPRRRKVAFDVAMARAFDRHLGLPYETELLYWAVHRPEPLPDRYWGEENGLLALVYPA